MASRIEEEEDEQEVGVHRVTLPLFGLAGEKDIFSGLDALGEFIQKLG